MIVATVEIENYKQFGGTHVIEFPQQGMVSVTGLNGAGKTTLFEAIEWCLYGPRTIPLPTIPPRDGVGNTCVRVTLEDPFDGRRYVVQRELRKGQSRAEVYCEDRPDQTIVQGPRDVTDYVSRQLIGLAHAAFVSTFFTRQKELTFFGDHAPTDRRMEVARLLGFQTIREAQEEIGAERLTARQQAASLRSQYERESEDRDFPGEIAKAEAVFGIARDALAASRVRLAAADDAFDHARAELDHWRTLQEQDAAKDRELLTIAGQVETATSRRDSALAELHRLEKRAAERAPLLPIAARVEELERVQTAFEAERERAMRLTALRENRDAQIRQRDAVTTALRRIVAEHSEAAAGLDGWYWRDRDDHDPAMAAARLEQAVATIDERGLRERARGLQRSLELAQRTETAKRKLDQYRAQWNKLKSERAALMTEGEPAARLQAAEAELARARAVLEEASGELTSARRERRESEELEQIFAGRSFGHICPTCTRPLSDDDAARLHNHLRKQSEQRRREEADWEKRVAELRAQVDVAEKSRVDAFELVNKLNALRDRLADGERMIGDLQAEQERDLAELAAQLEAVGREQPPEAGDVELASQLAEQASRVAALAGTLDQLRHRATVAAEGILAAEREIAELGVVSYNPEEHRATTKALEDARRAATVLAQIDLELARKPYYEEARDAAERELVELERARNEIALARAAIGFDPAALLRARDQETAAAAAQRAAREEVEQAREAQRDAETALAQIVAERDRVQNLATEADRRAREADELDRMYREFAEFDKFVADHVGPLLAESTERLLSLVTEGKYDRVRFDENYGIEVYDGDEFFPLGGFSGGERDVVSLCARLAMSELVGSSAHRPPRFLVLDEVFGSLDSERRAQLLETLGALAASGHFQQMFVISHIDDVQHSPAMSEAWNVEERDGVSRVSRSPVTLAAATA